MSEMVELGAPVKFKIMGREYDGKYGAGMLDTLRYYGYEVPSLCHHEAVTPYGACRVCLIEVVDKRGRSKITTSCNYPVQEGIDVRLDTAEVVKHRAMSLEMLVAMAPASASLRAFAAEHGVTKPRLEAAADGDCILCGLCERVCREVVGQNALGMFGRGTLKDVGPAYMEASDACIACGACAYVCPTKCIGVIDNADGSRTIDRWKRTLPLAVCEKTGRKFTPRYLLEHLGQKMGGLARNVLAKAPPYR